MPSTLTLGNPLEIHQSLIKHMAEAEKYDFIFQDAVYVNPKYDVTDKVINILNSEVAK